MEKNKKISVLIPCYNSEKYLKRLFESLLNQTITDFEIIIVNDGSTDNSEKIILEYKKKFKSKKINLIYLVQENKGQASAINNALKYVNTEYMIWTDSDDYYEIDAFEVLSKVLDENKKISYVKGNPIFRNENDLSIIEIPKPIEEKKTNLFEDYLFVTNNVCCFCGIVMMRVNDFKKANGGMEIYESRAGQNWQLLLPISYFYKGKYINHNIYNYVVRKQSHSHSISTDQQYYKRTYELEDVIISVLNHINMDNEIRKKYIRKIQKKYSRERRGIKIRNSKVYIILRKVKRLIWK